MAVHFTVDIITGTNAPFYSFILSIEKFSDDEYVLIAARKTVELCGMTT